MRTTYKIAVFTVSLILIVIFSQAQGQTPTWSKFSNTGLTARKGLSSTSLNGKIYVIGGSFLRDVIEYDPSADTWKTLPTQGDFPPHYGHSALVKDGKIYVIGGADGPITFSDSIWIFDPSNNTWSFTLPVEGTQFTERFDLACSVIGDNIYAIGGSSAPLTWISTVEVFNTKSRLWITPQVTRDSFHILETPKSFVIGDKIYVVGLPADSSCHCDVQIYDPKTNIWTVPVTNGMRTPRCYFAANEINGKIYIVGGMNSYNGGDTVGTTEVYDPELQTWSLFSTNGTFTAREQFASSVIGNKIFTIGGEQYPYTLNSTEVLTLPVSQVSENDNNKFSNNFHIYPNPATNTMNLVSNGTPAKFQIIDILGKVVMTGMTADHSTLTVDISALAKGIYSVLVNNEHGYPVEAGKVVVIGK